MTGRVPLPACATRSLTSSPTPAAPELSGLRILLVHEWLYAWAGAERCLEQFVALAPHANVLVGTVTPGMRREHAIAARAKATWVNSLQRLPGHHGWLLPLHAAALRTFDTRDYDLVISISHAFEKLVTRGSRPHAAHVCYCLTPPRFLWDLHETYDSHASPLQRGALRLAAPVLRAVDRHGAGGVDRFVSISRYVAERVRRSYGRESDVVYPPVVMKPGAVPGRREPFLLSIGRLVPYKRVDLAIAAAERLQMRLVVVGDGPERRRLTHLAGPHTEFVGRVPESEAARLLSTCAAFVFCAEEDFGIAPLEANAHGAPVVGYARGALAETMVPDETAVFFDRQAVDDVTRAIEQCLARTWDIAALRRNAERFSPQRFLDGIRAALAAVVEPMIRRD